MQIQGAGDKMEGTRAKILPLLSNQFQPQVSGQLAGLYETTKNREEICKHANQFQPQVSGQLGLYEAREKKRRKEMCKMQEKLPLPAFLR